MRNVARIVHHHIVSCVALTCAMAGLARADTFLIDFGAPGHVEYAGTDFGDAKIVNSSNPGEPSDGNSIKGLEYKLADLATLSSEKVGAYNLDGDTDPKSKEALTKSFIFANSDNENVGKEVTLTLKGLKAGDKVTFAFIRAEQNFDAHVAVEGGGKKEEKDVLTDKEFTEIGTLTGSETYTITISSVAEKTGESDIAGAKFTIEPAK